MRTYDVSTTTISSHALRHENPALGQRPPSVFRIFAVLLCIGLLMPF
jgi:hypothetical protein